MTSDLYSILGVNSTASEDEIKRAYFRQVREHSPEKDPEQFKLVRSAYETLSDAAARRDYDTLQQYGVEIQELLEEAEEFMDLEEWDEAIKRFKRILVLHPESNAARNSLGICYMQDEQYDAAIKTFTQLTKRSPDSAAYWMGLGYAHFNAADGLEEDSSGRREQLVRAQDAFARAVELEPLNSDAYQGVAHVRREFKDWYGAAKWLEAGVTADGETDLHDFDALKELCWVYLISDDESRLGDTLYRLVEIVPDDDDARMYMSWQLGRLGAQFAEVGAFKQAGMAFDQACHLDPQDEELSGARDAARRLGRAEDEITAMRDDELIVPPLRGLMIVRLMAAHGREVDDADFQETLEALDTRDGLLIAQSVARIKSSYPGLAALNSEMLEYLSRIDGDYAVVLRSKGFFGGVGEVLDHTVVKCKKDALQLAQDVCREASGCHVHVMDLNAERLIFERSV